MPTCRVCGAVYDTHAKRRGREAPQLTCPYPEKHEALVRSKAKAKKLMTSDEDWSPRSIERVTRRVEKIRDEIHKRRWGKTRRKQTGYQDREEWGDV